MSGMACRSCGVNAVSIRCLNCMEDRALMCMGCARHHNEIKVFHTHELVPLSGSYFDPRGEREHNTVQANTNHLNAVMGNGNGNAFRPNPNVNPTMSQMALQSYREREEALLRPPAAYRGLISSRPGSLTGPGGMGSQGLLQGQGQDLGPPNPSSISAGAYTSNIRNKVIHVTPATFHLIRSNALLLEDIKTCTGCKIFVSSASSHVTVTASVNAVELVGTNVQIEGAIKCLQDLTSALNSSKRKALLSKFPGPEDPEVQGQGQGSDPHRSPHLGPQSGPGPPHGQFNPQGPRGPGPWPPRPGEYAPQGYPGGLNQGPAPHQIQNQVHMNARDQMLAREQLQLQRLYAHSAGNVGVNAPHPSNVGTPRLGPTAPGPGLGPGSLGITSSPRAASQPSPLGMGIGARYSSPSQGGHGQQGLGQVQGQGLPLKPPSTGSTTLSATAAPFVFGQIQNSVPPSSTSGAAFLRSSGDADAVPLISDKLNNGNMDFEGDQVTNFNFESDGEPVAPGTNTGSGPAEESSEVEAMSRRFLTGLDEDMNYGLDSYAGFEEPFPIDDLIKTTASSIPDGCQSLRSLSPENPVLGDSGWDVNDGEKVDLFPSPSKKASQGPAPLLSSQPTVNANPVTIPTLPVPVPIIVPAVITAANVVIPLGTARFTGFTASNPDDESNPFLSGRSSANLSPNIVPSDDIHQSQAIAQSQGSSGFSLDDVPKEESPTSMTPPSENAVVKDFSNGLSSSAPPSSRIEWPFSKIGLLSGATGVSTLQDIMENTHTDITVDFGGPPGLPRKVVITGTREADVGLANVLLSDIIVTGSYVSFKESAGDLPQSSGFESVNSNRDNGSEVMFDQRSRASSGSFGPPIHNNDPLGFFPGGGRSDPNAAFAYPSLLGFNASQRDAEIRERERFPNGSPSGPEYRSQFLGGPLPSGEMSERERDQRMAAAGRFGGAPTSDSNNLAMTAQQQQMQLLQMTSRYPRLFPSASGGTGGPHNQLAPPRPSSNGMNPLSMPMPGSGGVAYPSPASSMSARHPPSRGPTEPVNRGFEGGFDDDPAFDAMRSESLNRAIERANASTGVILGEMLCPAEKISLIIGTKGSIINEISRKSNTVISIVDDDSRANPANPYGATANKTHRLILIRGSDEGVETAKRYISGVIASGPAYLNVEILSPSTYQNMAINMGMTMVGQEPFRGQNPALLGSPSGPYNRDGGLSQHPALSRPTSAAGSGRAPDYDDRYNPLAQGQLQGGPPGLADRLEYDREDRLNAPMKSAGPPGLMANPTDALLAESPFWGSNGNHSQYGGMDGGRIAPPPQLSFTDLKNAGIMNNTDSGNTAPDPNSRRSMARFQTYLDRTHAQQNQLTAGPALSSPVLPFAPTRGPPALGSDRVVGGGGGTYPRTLTEVLDTLTCPLEKIPLLLGPKGSTLRRIIDASGADIIINHELPPSVPRILEVRGTEAQVNCARDMIENILENENPSTSSLSGEALGSPSVKDEDEKLSTQDSHWMSMNASSFRTDGKSTDRFESLDDGCSDSKEKDEYEALYGKFMLEDSSGPPTPSRIPAVFVDNANYDEDYSVNSDEEHSDCLMLTQRVTINSQHLISVIQTNLGLLDRVANSTGTTVRLISRSSLNQFGCSDSAPNSPMKGAVTKTRNSLGSHSLDETELGGGDMQRTRVFQSAASPALSHVVMVSGLALQEVQSGVLVMRKVLQYLHAQSTHSTTTFKVISSLLIEHVSWAGDTLKDLTKSRTALIKDIGTTSGAGVVLIKKFTSSTVPKDAKAPVPPPALSISFADVLLKREPSLPVPAPAVTPASLVVAVSYHHQVVLIGSRFRLAAARTLLEKVISSPDDGFVSTSTSSASSVASLSVPNSGTSLVRIPPPPRRALDNDSRSDSENEDSYDSEDEDESYDSGSGEDSYSGNGMGNGRQWSRLDASDSKSEKRRGDDKERSNRRDDDETSNVVCILDCPNDKAGLVIGYKGSAIRTMSAKTRAKIVVTDAIINGGVSKRSVKILGTRKQVEKARALVERLMEIGTDAFDEDYNPASALSLKGVIVPTKETYITSATCSKQLERESRDKEKDRDGGAAYLSVELEFPNDVLRKYLASKNLEGVCKEILNRFFVVVTFPALSIIISSQEATSIVKLRGNRSQLDRAGVYLKRGVGSFKEREKEERVVTEVRPERKKRSSNKDRDSDNENDFEIRKYKNEYEKSDRKVEVRDREVVLDGGPWKSLDRDREEKDKKDKDKDKEEFVSVAVTVPCPASRAGCLIGSKGAVVKEIMRRTTARITISDEVILKLSPSALATNKDMTPDPTGYRWVTIKGGDDSVGAADALVRSVIELGAKALSK